MWLTDISKQYSGVTALKDVSIEFHKGEVHAVLGENGAGKSTLMKIISGAIQPTTGQIGFEDRLVTPMSLDLAADLGITISFQHPAILDDLTVLENFLIALPPTVFEDRSQRDVAKEALASVGLHVPLHVRGELLTMAERHLLEIAKALAVKPRVLLLDEPTAALDQDSTEMLFRKIREVVATGTSVIYITHRLAELRQIAHRVTVLRDGHVAGRAMVGRVTDGELLEMIVGRTLDSAFPEKNKATTGQVDLKVEGFTGSAFRNVSFEVRRGQIVGVAGVEGNGQSSLMRALAGIEPSTGTIHLKGRQLRTRDLLSEAALMPSDRLKEGVAGSLTVRENATVSALESFTTFGVLDRRKENAAAANTFRSLAVKTPSLDAPILSLSGGNQQKVVMARALLSEPSLIVADEPTQGVDVGARFEIYRILRELSSAGTPIIVNSSDAAELEGLCDEVIVLSRGEVVAKLTGDDVVEAKIVAAAVNAGNLASGSTAASPSRSHSWWRQMLQSDLAPSIPLTFVCVVLGLYLYSQNANFLSSYNISNVLLLSTALGFIALGQTVALMTGGIDLSVGPLAGFLVVVASFFINDGQSASTIALGFLLIFAGALVIGAINGVIIRYANFTPIAATLAMYIGLQGLSFVLREGVGGFISFPVTSVINYQIGPIPVAFIVLVALAVAGEYLLRHSRVGWRFRAIGSNEESARRNGVHTDRMIIGSYILVSLFTALGAVMLMAQIGVGDPRQGSSYTLASITAVALGGTSLRGGRGTFIGTVLGAVLVNEVLNAVAFQGLSQTYQYVFQGVLVLAAALVYSVARSRSTA